MTADMSGEQMQAKITAARREAEGLKDRIKRRKDELADASRTISPLFSPIVRNRMGLEPPLPSARILDWTQLTRDP